MKTIIIAAAMTLCVVFLASADTLIMRDGTRIQGTVTAIAGRTITFRHADGQSRRYATSHVASLEFFSADRANPRATSGLRLEVPADTELMVRTIEAIDSRNAGADRAFSAMFEQRVLARSGRVLIPEGASAQLVIREVSADAKTGSREMVLDMRSITVGGRRYLVDTPERTEDGGAGISANGRTTETLTGSVAVGPIIGAVPVGGTGASTRVVTKGRDVTVPTETLLTFRLDKPATLRAEQ
jgi:hypothetical protein